MLLNGFKKLYERNPVVRAFLQKKYHCKLLERAVSEPSEENNTKLDQVFKEFYAEIRLIKYVSVVIHNNASSFDKKNRLQHKRFPLSLDQPLKNYENHALIDFVASDQPQYVIFNKHTSLEDYVDDPILYAGLQRLTVKEKGVLKLVFVFDLTVTDIAKIMNVSHQTVSKTKHKALRKLREHFLDARGGKRY